MLRKQNEVYDTMDVVDEQNGFMYVDVEDEGSPPLMKLEVKGDSSDEGAKSANSEGMSEWGT